MAAVRLEQVEKVYPGGYRALLHVSLAIPDGELCVLVGPSGCGKSTLLRLIAGLEQPSAGHIWLGDREITAVSPQDRDIAMVFQSYALYPHLTVHDNLAFGLRMRGLDRSQIGRRVTEVARTLGLDQLLQRKPAQLSGGQRQRVALGRAIIREPQVFLLDEPLSNLDVRLRVETRAEIARLHRRLQTTMIYVTHDQEEAMTLGQRIAVLNEGHLLQVAPPLELYHRPVNMFVAGFLGSPPMNFIHGRLADSGENRSFVSEIGTFAVDKVTASTGGKRTVVLGVRPHDLKIIPAADAQVRGIVDVMEPHGSETVVYVRIGETLTVSSMRVVVSADLPLQEGQAVGLQFPGDRLHFFAPESGERVD
ncbi:MAG: ABC transporter ATP-binding protein [Candidatus Binatia bacterium]